MTTTARWVQIDNQPAITLRQFMAKINIHSRADARAWLSAYRTGVISALTKNNPQTEQVAILVSLAVQADEFPNPDGPDQVQEMKDRIKPILERGAPE